MNSYDTQPCAVLLSGNVSSENKKTLNEIALALTRSLGCHGLQVIRFHPDRSLVDLNSRFCSHTACPNLCDSETRLTDSQIAFSQPKLVENMARAVRKSAIATAAGVDPAWITYHALTSTSRTEPVFNYSVPMRGIRLQDETQAAADLVKAGKLGLWEWLRFFHGRIVVDERARNDLRPGVQALSLLLRRLFNLTILADKAQLVGAESV
jgi:hypothetical protein